MVEQFRRLSVSQMESAGVRTVERVARMGKTGIRSRFAAASLGKLGNAIDANADKQAVRYGRDGFSVSARFFVRSRSERTLGAIESYTQGSEIHPVRSRWLWIATDDVPRVTKRQRLTPALWRQNGLDRKIGPLFQIRSVNGYPLLAVQDVGVALSGKRGSARSLTRKGLPRKGQVAKPLIIAFVGIPRTARAARVNVTNILIAARSEMPSIFEAELAKERR